MSYLVVLKTDPHFFADFLFSSILQWLCVLCQPFNASETALGQTVDASVPMDVPLVWLACATHLSSGLSHPSPHNVYLSHRIKVLLRTCTDTHAHTVWQILPSAKKSINKCIVSSLCAAGIGLSKLSDKAAECEIEFRTVCCVRGHQDERMFPYLFILQQQQHLVVALRHMVSCPGVVEVAIQTKALACFCFCCCCILQDKLHLIFQRQ